MRTALAGNPNSGKTTLYNAITGGKERVGNWAGVTVEKKERKIKKKYSGTADIIAIDLPGAYSVSAFTGEESITSNFIKNEKPDVIINIVDAANISRSLFFTTQLLELGIPVVVALNKTDVNERKGTRIDVSLLSKLLGCPVIETVSTAHTGLKELISAVISVQNTKQKAPFSVGDIDINDKEALELEKRRRFDFVNEIIKKTETRAQASGSLSISDKIDAVITNKWLGIPIFAAIMLLVFQISQTWLGTWIAEGYEFDSGFRIYGLTDALELFQEWLRGVFANASPLLAAILVDGIIGGAVAVVGFLPLVMILYFLIALLEDIGYMSRVAVLFDPIFKKAGLSGKSVIPFVMSVGCAVPGIMASRTIKSERERRAAAMLAPFIPCGAKIPVISLFAGAFFDNAGWVSALVYFSGIILIFFGAFIVNKITAYNPKKSYFIIELPEYRVPSFSNAFKSMCSRGWAYIVKAATVILLCNTAVQLMQSFTWSLSVAQSADESILADIALPFAYVLFPVVGIFSWQLAAAAVTGFIAKENVVGTLAVCFAGLENLIDTEELAIMSGTGAEIAWVIAISKIAALAYLMFNLYSPPCFAAIGAMNSEMKSVKWLWAGIGLQLGLGYTVGYLVYTVGTLAVSPSELNSAGAFLGLAAVMAFAGVILLLMLRTKNIRKEERV